MTHINTPPYCPPNETPMGRCSICGGVVTVPLIWGGVYPPVPRCRACGAVMARPQLPVIPMEAPPRSIRVIGQYGALK